MKKEENRIYMIQSLVSQKTGVSIEDILSPSRKANTVLARHLSMYLCRRKSNHNLLTIAKSHGRDNHGTVIHACKIMDWEYQRNTKIKQYIDEIKSNF